MFTGKVRTDGKRLFQESNLHIAARQPRRAPHHVIQATTSEGVAQSPYMSVAARVGVEPSTLRTEGTKHHYSVTPRHVNFNNIITIIIIIYGNSCSSGSRHGSRLVVENLECINYDRNLIDISEFY